jgi:hypothetical protein
VVVAAKRLNEAQVIVARVLDVVTAIAPDQGDITGPEVGGVACGPVLNTDIRAEPCR